MLSRLTLLFVFCLPAVAPAQNSHSDLVALFQEWRSFHAPAMVDGVPDYTAEAMSARHTALPAWYDKLAAIDTTGWPVSEQIDVYLVWAEMNGLDFAHRVKSPWTRMPAFYIWFYPSPTDVPEREGPNIFGAIELPNYATPLSAADADELTRRLAAAPALYEQARINLTGNARDLWSSGIMSIDAQTGQLQGFADTVEPAFPDLATSARTAAEASASFAEWLRAELPEKTGLSGVGKENYSWNMRNVHLLPYDWQDEVDLMWRELYRSHASLRLEEARNQGLPELDRIDSPQAYDAAIGQAIEDMLAFFETSDIMDVEPYFEPALREQAGSYQPIGRADDLRNFFAEVMYRDPMTMRLHHYHWIDLARMREDPHPSPIRATPLLYNIFDSRAEGVATGLEEMMTHAGIMDDRPRGREQMWIMLAMRAARAIGGLHQHGGEMTMQEATEFAEKWTPRELFPAESSLNQWEQAFYLRQPPYGSSYVTGKAEVERILAAYSRQQGASFSMREFFRVFNDAGVIPTTLIYWELTGDRGLLDQVLER
ncbi:MAG: DUF885 family protein [Bacteroidota bacterium]